MSDTHAQTVRFVRETMVPPSEPPTRESGVVKWLRENLFSGWLNGILSVLSILFVGKLAIDLVPWFWNSVWTAGSLNECREVLMVTIGGVSDDGACFAVLKDRWLQLMFGFYPVDLYWRPILAFVLLFVALAPVLFSNKLPKQMLAFSLSYPFFATWLFWGGSVWLPILAMGGFGAAYVVGKFASRFAGMIGAVVGGIVGAVLFWSYASPVINDMLHKTIANARMEQAVLDQSAVVNSLPERQAEIAARLAVVNATATELTVAKDAIATEIKSARDAGEEPSSARIDEYLSIMDSLMVARREVQALNFADFSARQAASDANGLLNKIQSLPVWEEELPIAQANVDAMKEALPETVSGLISVKQVAPGTPAEDIAALQAMLDAQKATVALEANIVSAYETVGLFGLTPVSSRDFGGFVLAVIIGVAGIVLSLPLGILLALGRRSDLPIVKGFSVAFIEMIRGVPLIVWLFTAYYLLNYFLPPGTEFDLILRVVIMVTLFSAAYIAEVVRGGLAALPKGQFEAADSLGLDYWKAMRLIVLPQALKISIPGIVNTFIGLYKDTTLVGIIGLLDPLNLSNSIRASTDWNGVYYELFVFIGLFFFISCFSMGRYSLWLENKLQRGHR